MKGKKIKMEAIGLTELKNIFACLKKTMSEERQKLIEMDSVVGDGDLGITMDKAFSAGSTEVDSQLENGETDIAKVLMKAGMKMASAAPSTMGTLMGSGFMSGGKALKGTVEIKTKELADFFNAFLEVVMQRGKAQPGDKTVIDVLKPVADKLSELADSNTDIVSALKEITRTSAGALEATKEMVAQHGKAATFSEKSKGLVDQGAYVINLIVGCFSTLAD